MRLASTALLIGLACASASADPPVEKHAQALGLRLQYLDWGGRGETLLFVPGGCDTGYVFSDIAPAFVDQFQVMSFTMRGCGGSEKPEDGYELAVQLEELAAFLDAVGAARATLAGHSSGGGKITAFAKRYPARVSRLIYFDTVYSFVAPGLEEKLGAAIAERVGGPPTGSEDRFRDSMRDWELGAWSDGMDANLRETFSRADDRTLRNRAAPGRHQAFASDMRAGRYFETDISHPALMFFAMDLDRERTRRLPEPARAKIMPLALKTDRRRRDQIARFQANGEHGIVEMEAMPAAWSLRIVEMEATAHYCFVHRPNAVIREMQRFFRETERRE